MIDIRHGDCLELLKTIEDGSVDLILTDPPYNISQKNFCVDRSKCKSPTIEKSKDRLW